MAPSEQQQEPPMKKSKKTLMPFRADHAERFGLRVGTHGPDDASHVTSCVCRFCEAFGREDNSSSNPSNDQPDQTNDRRTRRKTQRTKYFKTFRTDLYTQHLLKEHPGKWAAYQQLRSESDKQNFFESANCDLTFDINASIVETIIGELLFNPDDVDGVTSLKRALSVFEPRSGSGKGCGYVARIKTPKRFSLLVRFVATGASLRHAAHIMETVADETKLACFGDCDEVVTSNYVRVACAVALQQLSDVLGSLTGFSLALDSFTVHGASYLDLRVHFAVQGVLYDFHLLTLPLHEHHNERLVFGTLVEFLDALYSPWREILVGVATDNVGAMTARVRGLATLLEREATGRKLLRVWSGLSQLDRVVVRVCQAPLGETFCSTMTAVIGYLRHQPTLLKEMQTTCPKVADTSGTSDLLSIEKSCRWLTSNIIALQIHFETKRPPCAPTKCWLILLFAVHAFVREASIVVDRLYGSTKPASVSEQHATIHRLISTYCSMTKMVGPLTEAELALIDRSCHEVCGQFALSHADAFAYIEHDLDVWVVQALEQLDTEDVRSLGVAVAKLFVQGATRVYEIVAASGDPDSADSDNYDELPSVALPAELVKMNMRAFSELLSEHTPRLSKRLSATKIHKVAQEFAALRRAYTNEEIFVIAFDKSANPATSYNDSWAVIGEHFPDLRSFCGDLASTFPSAAIAISAGSRKGDGSDELSIIDQERDAFRQRLANFSVEGVLQCKQYAQLTQLAASLK